jgi:hypothetical protein
MSEWSRMGSLAFLSTLGDAGVQPGPVRPDDANMLVEPTGRRVDSGALGGTTRL